MTWREAFVRAVLVGGGLFYLISAVLLLFGPVWFFDNIGTYPPYNRHYEGDTGSFTLVLGLVLCWAVREPARYRAMIAAVGIGSLVHAMNHVVDDFVLNATARSMTNNIFLFLFAIALLLAAWWAVPQRERASDGAIDMAS
jgi:hypothetical protein